MTFSRISPIVFSLKPADTHIRDHWRIVKKYEEEGDGPHLVDLSHCPKWDLQTRDLSSFAPWGFRIPENPGETKLVEGWLVNRMNATQASIWLLDTTRKSGDKEAFSDRAFTETTDSLALVVLVGKDPMRIMETLTSMDLHHPRVTPPWLFQGPVLGIPSQVVRLGENGDQEAFLIGFSRGYGQSMAEAVLEAGEPYGLTPGGEGVFTLWLSGLP